jgi:hypothetical protein
VPDIAIRGNYTDELAAIPTYSVATSRRQVRLGSRRRIIVTTATAATPASSASPSPRRQAAGGANRQHGQRLATVTASSSRPRPRAPSPPTATARSSLSSVHHGADRRPIADGIPLSRHVSTIDQRQACHPVTKKGRAPSFFMSAASVGSGIRYVLVKPHVEDSLTSHIWDAINDERPSAPRSGTSGTILRGLP